MTIVRTVLGPRTALGFVAALISAVSACGGVSEEDVEATAGAAVATAVAAIPPTSTPAPTATPPPTPVPTATPLPTSTPMPSATPQPTPTLVPTATPQPPPTMAPTASPQPPPTPAPTATPQPITDFAGLFEEAKSGVFQIEAPDSIATAFLFEENLLLTNQHVVDEFEEVILRHHTGQRAKGIVMGTDVDRDLAVIRLETPVLGAKRLQLADSINNTRIAEPVLAIGYSSAAERFELPAGLPSANVGVVARVTRINKSLGLGIEMDAPIDPGDSGGPVLNGQGQVIGINRAVVVSAGAQRVVGTFLAIAADEIREALPNLVGES